MYSRNLQEPLAKLFTKMIEWDCVPAPVRRFYISPLDKTGKDPRKCAKNRRLMSRPEGKLAEEHYAYQKARGAEFLLAHLERFATQGRQEGWMTYMVGLDVAGAFDSASLPRLVETLRVYATPGILRRFTGAWLTGRSPTIKMSTPGGAAMGSPCRPSRGVPQGGVPSPPLWILHVNRVSGETLRRLRALTTIPRREWGAVC